MTNVILELICIKNLLTEIDFLPESHETIWWEQSNNTHCWKWRVLLLWENKTHWDCAI